MKKEELIEDYLVYTDNGIERVHWCNVNGVKELVSPKGKVYGYVPDYFEVKRLRERNKKLEKMAFHYTPEEWNTMLRTNERLQEQLNEANEVIKWYDGLENMLIGWEMVTGQPAGTAKKYLDKWGVK